MFVESTGSLPLPAQWNKWDYDITTEEKHWDLALSTILTLILLFIHVGWQPPPPLGSIHPLPLSPLLSFSPASLILSTHQIIFLAAEGVNFSFYIRNVSCGCDSSHRLEEWQTKQPKSKGGGGVGMHKSTSSQIFHHSLCALLSCAMHEYFCNHNTLLKDIQAQLFQALPRGQNRAVAWRNNT